MDYHEHDGADYLEVTLSGEEEVAIDLPENDYARCVAVTDTGLTIDLNNGTRLVYTFADLAKAV